MIHGSGRNFESELWTEVIFNDQICSLKNLLNEDHDGFDCTLTFNSTELKLLGSKSNKLIHRSGRNSESEVWTESDI